MKWVDKKDIKFSVVIPGSKIASHIQDALQEQPSRSGMYNWIMVFQGEMNNWRTIEDRFWEYDILQVNMSPVDLPLVREIRRAIDKRPNCKTKLVLNNDYVCEYWNNWQLHPWEYDNYQRCADMLFGTEYFQVSNMLPGTFIIPHPTNTKVLKRLGYDKTDKRNSIGAIYHWWCGQSHLTNRTLEIMKKRYSVKESRLFGYRPDLDLMKKWDHQMFDKVTHLISFEKYIDLAQKQEALFDPNPYHTYGRNGVEAACLGIPIVGSDRVFSQRFLFPELACDPYDVKGQIERMDIVFRDPERRKKILAQAYEKVEHFSYASSRHRYLQAMDAAEKLGYNRYYKHVEKHEVGE